MVAIKRWFLHACMPPWRWRLAFPAAVLKDIETAIKQSESQHRGELRFAIENTLAAAMVWKGMSGHNRAIDIFSNLRVWDTEENSGVLIYLLLADREVHIIADRGIAKQVSQTEWDAVAHAMQKAFRSGQYRNGALEGIEQITKILATYFPPREDNPNELSNKPVIIKNN
jgi:uncharacterized membrane protein